MIMPGIYVHDTVDTPYAEWIMCGAKTIETRTRDVLGKFVGKRVLVIRTGRGPNWGPKAEVIGSVYIRAKEFLDADQLNERRGETLIPSGSKYDCHGKGKWCYYLSDPMAIVPIPLEKLTVIKRNMSYATISFMVGGNNHDF